MRPLDAIAAGELDFRWSTIVSEHGGRKLRMSVFSDAAKVDGVRASVSAVEAQMCADQLFAVLPTPRIEDLIHLQADLVVQPVTRIDGNINAMSTDRRHSELVDELVGGHAGLVSTVGKSWVLCRALGGGKYGRRTAYNYGWHTRSGGYSAVTRGLLVWQPPAGAHNDVHRDPSQTLRLVSRHAELEEPDGKIVDVDLHEVLRSPTLAPLVSHEGAMTLLRQPSVPFQAAVDPEATKPDHVDTEPAPAPVLVLPEVTIYGSVPASDANGSEDSAVIPFLQAKNYTPANRKGDDLKWIVVHTAETGEVKGAAMNLARWAASPSAPKASWHFAVDCDGIIQSVRVKDVAWHAKQGNRFGIGIEHAGRARQIAEEWDDTYSRAVLRRSAALVAKLCRDYSIPVRRVGPEDILRGEKGICGHDDFTTAYKVKGGHYDPGPHFPWAWYIELVRGV